MVRQAAARGERISHEDAARMIEGWRDQATGEVVLVHDNLSSGRAARVWMHEQVAHNGLRQVFGDMARFNRFLDAVADAFNLKGSNRRLAAEEELARIAEKMKFDETLTPKERSFWQRLIDEVRFWMAKHGLRVLKPEEISEVLREALARTVHGNPEGRGRAEGLQEAGVFSAKELADPYRDGPIFREYAGRPKEAIERLLREQRGVALGALDVPGLGPVDLMWGKTGKTGWGVGHIVERRNASGMDGVAFVRELPGRLQGAHAEIREGYPGRAYVVFDGGESVIRLDWNGKDQRWLLTAYGYGEKSASPASAGRQTSSRTFGDGQRIPPSRGRGLDEEITTPPAPGKSSGPGDTNFSTRPERTPEEVRADEDTAIQALGKASPRMGWMARHLGSPEYWKHPVMRKVFQVFRNRHDRAIEILNDVMSGGALSKWKALDKGQKALLTDIVDIADVRELKPKGVEPWMEEQGIPEPVREVWRLMRQGYDKLLDERLKPYEEMLAQGLNDDIQYVDSKGNRVSMSLREAVNEMRSLEGSYAPRIRPTGDFAVLARRKGPDGEWEYARHHTD